MGGGADQARVLVNFEPQTMPGAVAEGVAEPALNEDVAIVETREHARRASRAQHPKRIEIAERRAAETQRGRERLEAARERAVADVAAQRGARVRPDALETLLCGYATHHLTLMETNLLKYLVDRTGQAVSRKNMLEDVWNLREDTDTRAIDHFIARLRKYIEDEPARPKHLLTVRGVGYKFVTDSVPKRQR